MAQRLPVRLGTAFGIQAVRTRAGPNTAGICFRPRRDSIVGHATRVCYDDLLTSFTYETA